MTTKAVQDTKAADGAGPEMKSLEYHRQVLQSKMAQEGFVRQEREQQRHLRDGGQQRRISANSSCSFFLRRLVQQATVHLAVGQHYESLHREAHGAA